MPDIKLKDLKEMHDKAYTYSQVTRERAADDLVFYFISQWDDTILTDSQLLYRGEFNILRKAGRKILGDLEENPVQIDFVPDDDDKLDSGELLDGMYRFDDSKNTSIDSYRNAKQETVVCGQGAWELYTDKASNRTEEDKQIIKRKPILEANNTVFWDPNAKLLDKSDATYVSVLTAYSEDGYRDLVIDLTGEDPGEVSAESFKSPEQSYVFPWVGLGSNNIYVGSIYIREKISDKIITMLTPMGEELDFYESDVKDVMDEMKRDGFTLVEEIGVKRYQVTKYICSGKEILSTDIIVGEEIPIIPMFGERAYVEGEEHWEGITRLTKDPQRLRNFQLSYLADIVSRSPRQKPIFWKEQIAGFEQMYEISGSDNNYPYLLMNRKNGVGEEIPLGQIGVMPEQKMPDALVHSINLSREAVEDVANPGIPQDIADPDISGKAVLALEARIDQQSIIYQQNFKHAKRRDAEVYKSMAKEIHDIPRKVKIELPDGTKKDAMVLETVIDNETGEIITLNDLNNVEFDVYPKIGPSYSSQREQTVEKLSTIYSGLQPGEPEKKVVLLKMLKLMDGVDFDDIREYANKQLVVMGIKKPETDEEKEALAMAQQQGDKPTVEMILAEGELRKGEAAVAKAQNENMKIQLEAQNEGMKRMVDNFEAVTNRLEAMIKGQEAGAKIDNTNVDTIGKELDNASKIIELKQPEDMTDDELFQQALAG